VNVGLALAALALRLVRRSAVVPGVLLGATLYVLTGRAGFAVLVAFFVFGTAVTRWGFERKAARGTAEEQGGRRGGSHVIANGLAAFLVAVAARFFPQRPDLWAVAYVASFAAALSDTASSEIGPLASGAPFDLRTGRRVPAGTPGAVSAAGTAAGAAAAVALSLLASALGLLTVPAAAAAAAGGFGGNLCESLLVAFRGRRSPGHQWLNTANTAVGAAIAVALAALL
jgi:uncharacterized protein (TIGR00297 family)